MDAFVRCVYRFHGVLHAVTILHITNTMHTASRIPFYLLLTTYYLLTTHYLLPAEQVETCYPAKACRDAVQRRFPIGPASLGSSNNWVAIANDRVAISWQLATQFFRLGQRVYPLEWYNQRNATENEVKNTRVIFKYFLPLHFASCIFVTCN